MSIDLWFMWTLQKHVALVNYCFYGSIMFDEVLLFLVLYYSFDKVWNCRTIALFVESFKLFFRVFFNEKKWMKKN